MKVRKSDPTYTIRAVDENDLLILRCALAMYTSPYLTTADRQPPETVIGNRFSRSDAMLRRATEILNMIAEELNNG